LSEKLKSSRKTKFLHALEEWVGRTFVASGFQVAKQSYWGWRCHISRKNLIEAIRLKA